MKIVSGHFDPYYTWLGIRPTDQPPHHYRLLGIDVFEENSDVISNAADQRMAHLRSFQTGPRGVLSQKLLDQVARARVVLLDPEKKAEYDASLRASLIDAAPADNHGAVGGLSVALDLGLPSGAVPRRSTLSVNRWIVLMLLLAGVGAGGALIYTLSSSGGSGEIALIPANPAEDAKRSRPDDGSDSDSSALPSAPQTGGGAESAEANPAVKDTAAADFPSENLATETPSTHEKTGGVQVELHGPAKDKNTSVREGGSPAGASGEAQPGGKPAPADAPPVPDHARRPGAGQAQEPDTSKPADARRAPPDEAALAEARKLLEDIFGERIAAAKDREQKQSLAVQLLETAQETKGDGVGRYVLRQEAARLAAEAGDPVTITAAISAQSEEYVIDAVRLRASAFYDASRENFNPTVHRQLIDAALELMDEAAALDRFDIAVPLEKVLQNSARRVRDRDVNILVRDRVQHVKQQAASFRDFAAARQAIQDDPQNAAAHTVAGKYLCLAKGQWPEGLKHLAQGDDEALRKLAEREQTPPESPEDRIALADAWFTLAEAGEADAGFFAKADYWYRQSLPDIQGLARLRIEDRLEQTARYVKSVPRPHPAGSSGGNVLATAAADARIALRAERLVKVEHPGRVEFRHLAFSPRGDQAAAVDDAGEVLIFDDLKQWKVSRRLPGHKGKIHRVAYASDGSLLATGGEDGAIVIWERGGQPRHRLLSGSPVTDLAFADRNHMVVSAHAGRELRMWNVRNGLPVGSQNIVGVHSIDVAPDGATTACGTSGANLVLLFDKNGAPRHALRGHSRTVQEVEFSADGRRLASIGESGEVKFWDPGSGRLQNEFAFDDSIYDLAVSPEGRLVAVATKPHLALIFDSLSGKLRGRLPTGDRTTGIDFSPDGKLLAVVSNRYLQVWKLAPTIEPPTVFNGGTTMAELKSRPLHVAAVVHAYDPRPEYRRYDIDLIFFSDGKSSAADGSNEWNVTEDRVSFLDGEGTVEPGGRHAAGRWKRGAYFTMNVIWPPDANAIDEIHSIWRFQSADREQEFLVALQKNGRAFHRAGQGTWSRKDDRLTLSCPAGEGQFAVSPDGASLQGTAGDTALQGQRVDRPSK